MKQINEINFQLHYKLSLYIIIIDITNIFGINSTEIMW
jgi:hypothetical protein